MIRYNRSGTIVTYIASLAALDGCNLLREHDVVSASAVLIRFITSNPKLGQMNNFSTDCLGEAYSHCGLYLNTLSKQLKTPFSVFLDVCNPNLAWLREGNRGSFPKFKDASNVVLDEDYVRASVRSQTNPREVGTMRRSNCSDSVRSGSAYTVQSTGTFRSGKRSLHEIEQDNVVSAKRMFTATQPRKWYESLDEATLDAGIEAAPACSSPVYLSEEELAEFARTLVNARNAALKWTRVIDSAKLHSYVVSNTASTLGLHNVKLQYFAECGAARSTRNVKTTSLFNLLKCLVHFLKPSGVGNFDFSLVCPVGCYRRVAFAKQFGTQIGRIGGIRSTGLSNNIKIIESDYEVDTNRYSTRIQLRGGSLNDLLFIEKVLLGRTNNELSNYGNDFDYYSFDFTFASLEMTHSQLLTVDSAIRGILTEITRESCLIGACYPFISEERLMTVLRVGRLTISLTSQGVVKMGARSNIWALTVLVKGVLLIAKSTILGESCASLIRAWKHQIALGLELALQYAR